MTAGAGGTDSGAVAAISCAGEATDPDNHRTAPDIEKLDPYGFLAILGKKVIHPGGRQSTEEMLRFADFKAGERVLDVGAGVGTTAVEIARRFGCKVTAIDIDPLMLERARANVRAAGASNHVTVKEADIQSLPYQDGCFDKVIIEAVTMFVDRERAAREVVRVCRSKGRVLDHEFIYRKTPTREIRRLFEGEVCPGIRFDRSEDWIELYRSAGLTGFQQTHGPFAMMTPMGMLRDEGILNLSAIMAKILLRPTYFRKMTWMMSRMVKVWPYLGYIVLSAEKP